MAEVEARRIVPDITDRRGEVEDVPYVFDGGVECCGRNQVSHLDRSGVRGIWCDGWTGLETFNRCETSRSHRSAAHAHEEEGGKHTEADLSCDSDYENEGSDGITHIGGLLIGTKDNCLGRTLTNVIALLISDGFGTAVVRKVST